MHNPKWGQSPLYLYTYTHNLFQLHYLNEDSSLYLILSYFENLFLLIQFSIFNPSLISHIPAYTLPYS
jgi:hypothetical protein